MNKKLFLLIGLLILAVVAYIYTQSGITNINDRLPQDNTPETITVTDPIGEPSQETSSDTTVKDITEAFSKKYDRPGSSFIITVNTDTGLFAHGSVKFTDEPSGGLWFAARTDKGWELAFDGNGIVPCNIAGMYDFPPDMIPGCINTLNDNQYVVR